MSERADISRPGVLLVDQNTGQKVYVPLDEAQAKLASGQYAKFEGSVVKTDRLGATVDNTLEGGRAQVLAGESFVDGAVAGQEQLLAERRAAFDTLADEALTFAEGVASVASFGAIKGRSEQDKFRRETNPLVAGAGEVVGLGASILASPASILGKLPTARVAQTSEALGKAAARKLFGEARKGPAALAARATKEAVENAAMSTAMAAGHGVVDSLIEDKPFAAETLTASLWSDAAVGAGFGAAGHLLGKARSSIKARDAIRSGAGVLDASSDASKAVHQSAADAVSALDSSLENYKVRIGVLKQARDGGEMGRLGDDFIVDRQVAIKQAETAGKRLRQHDLAAALAGDDPKAVARALKALDEYGNAMARLDDAMRPGNFDRAMMNVGPPVDVVKQHADFMAQLEPEPSFAEGSGEGLGGIDTPSSRNSTAAGKRGARPQPEAAPAVDGPVPSRLDESDPATVVDGPRDLAAPDLMGPHQKSPLAAFAYDVENVAAQLGSGKLEDVLAAMGRPNRAPMTLDRFRELVGEAEMAGYLRTAGDGVDVPYLGARVGNEIVPSAPAQAGYKADKRARFGGWGDQGNRKLAPDTIVDGAPPSSDPLLAQLQASAGKAEVPDLLAGKTYKEQEPFGKGQKPGRAVRADDTYAEGPPSFTEPAPAAPIPVDAAVPAASAHPNAYRGQQAIKPGGALDGIVDDLAYGRGGAGINEPAMGPRVDPGELAARKVREAIAAMEEISGGRLNNGMAREAAEAAGLKLGTHGPLADHLAAVWGLRQLARAAGDAAKGGSKPSSLMSRLVKRSGISAGRALFSGGRVGSAVMGAVGGVAGGHLVGLAMGTAGAFASSVGKARDMAVKAGAALLSGRGSRVAASIPIAARYSYDGSEPTEDVAERVQQLQTVLADPEAARSQIAQQLGVMNTMDPMVAQQAVENRLRQLGNLSLRAPTFVWDALGESRPAGQQGLRKFREYEDGTWDRDGLLADVAAGSISDTRAACLREQHPETHALVCKQLLSDQQALRRAPKHILATVQRITGVPLTLTRGPAYIMRQQAPFQPPAPPAPTPGASAVRAPTPTPAQAIVAPGN